MPLANADRVLSILGRFVVLGF